ncbi:MAG TPA: HD domain-containing protein [Stackebrandtia sp.]|jgi:GTP pyrophosphokinase|uniref:RelA/SpoT family protein n=1 Tax=Stackebrandtia sp. TaxID=2023065 RepID=UPI002D22A23B|nr:HD domain-containing protein [Stackebrandtia sp.]HZE39737.1 HD domain-containing protein [Stackebrandtia sp.]
MLRGLLNRSSPDDDPWGVRASVVKLEQSHRANNTTPAIPLLRKAFRIAEEMHRGQNRKSGEPYITHPIAVAQISADLGLDTTTIAAALLHDTVEDTSYTLQRLRDDFGNEVAVLVDGMTKLDKVYFGDAAEAETFRKLIVTAGRDVRVMVIKLADRLHNMRTIIHKSHASQIRIAEATRDVLIPLADRLGLYVIKRELEDIVLSTVDPDVYREIDDYLECNTERADCVAQASAALRYALRTSKIDAQILDRPRHHYSVYREMAVNPRRGPQDPPRVVLLVDGPITDCYATLGEVHRLWRPLAGRFKDFIATPKFNLYQSLHTSVIGPGDEPMDVLIRTSAMHRTAELGIVAHLAGEDNDGSPTELTWLHRLLDWQSDAIDSGRFLESLRCDLSDEQVLVFTTSGGQHMLPVSATPVDLAYCMGASDGDRLIGAYVNGHLAPLSTQLSEGDLVETITADAASGYPGPSREWLLTARTPQAQLLISQWFAGYRGPHTTESARQLGGQRTLTDRIEAGRHAVESALRVRDRGLASTEPLIRLGLDLGYPDLDALYMAVYDKKLDALELADKLIASVDRQPQPELAP